jgi:hypothetical protein
MPCGRESPDTSSSCPATMSTSAGSSFSRPRDAGPWLRAKPRLPRRS